MDLILIIKLKKKKKKLVQKLIFFFHTYDFFVIILGVKIQYLILRNFLGTKIQSVFTYIQKNNFVWISCLFYDDSVGDFLTISSQSTAQGKI